MFNKYLYDHMGRKLKTWEQITNGTTVTTPTLISQVDYNEIGQVMTKHLHSTDSVNFFQNIAYTYNERGWLLGSAAPLFSEQLQYNSVNNVSGIAPTAQYNGNIASQTWTSSASSGSYLYKYDKLNRLLSGGSTDHYDERGITYDLQGNIQTLNRVYNGTVIDSLAYTYNSTNQVQSIADKSTNTGTVGYKKGTFTYVYDGNGNMATDNSKSITITYNLLNFPQTITAKSTTYTYDASGQKLRRVVSTALTDYINGIEYDGTSASNEAITFIQTEEGRALPNGNSAYNYEYNLSDHLGNSRLTFDSATGAARTEQQDNYMPFGMDITVGSEPSPQNFYLYNKKELQASWGVYDYGFRFYDLVIGRWTTVDPLREDDYFPGAMKQKRQSFGAQNSDDNQEDDNDSGDMGSPAFTAESSPVHYDMSPYNYVMNNPMRYIDLLGLDTGKVTHLKEVVITGYVKHGIAPTIGLFTWPIPKTLFGPILPGASKSTTLLSYGLSKWWTKPINWYGKRRLFTHVGENGVKRYASTWGRYFGRRLSIGLGEASTIYTILDVSYSISDYLSPKIINALPYSDQAKAPEMMGDGKTVWHPEH